MDQTSITYQSIKKMEETIGFYFAGLIGFCLFAYMMSQPLLVVFSFFFYSKASKEIQKYEEAKELLRESEKQERD